MINLRKLFGTILAILFLQTLSCISTAARSAASIDSHQKYAFSQSAQSQSQDDAVQSLLNQAQEFTRRRQFDQAVEVLRRAVQMKPALVSAHVQLGLALMQTGQLNEALAEMRRAIELNPNDARAYAGLGNVEGAMRRYDEAIDAYRQAISLDPNYFAAYNNLGIAYGTTNRYAESEEAFRQALRIDSNNADAWNGLGIAQFRTGQREEAISSLKRAVQLNPRDVNVYLNLARWYQELGRYEESADAFTEVTRIVPRFPATYFERSLDYFYLGRGEAAAADARTFLDLTNWHTDRAEYMVILAALGYRRAGRDADAKQILDTAFRRSNNGAWPFPIINYLRGEMTAESLLAIAIDNDRMTEARAYIGMDLMLKGRNEEAVQHFRWVREHGNRRFVEYNLAAIEIERLGQRSSQ
ncbi:MAG TPA: tetratricopeptide repeat protein [Pyrinomonadaceae bacterium]|nr:tetratricopeptide repeat protein [Pyrinomonadaceae bacterium]